MVQPNLQRTTTSLIVQTFHSKKRCVNQLYSVEGRQEEAIYVMVIAYKAISLKEVQTSIISDNNVFENVLSVSINLLREILTYNLLRRH